MCKNCDSLCTSRICPCNLEDVNSKVDSFDIYNFGNGHILNDENSAAEELLSR